MSLSFIVCKNIFKNYLDKYSNIHIFQNHIMIFRVGPEMDIIIMEFSKKKFFK